MSLSRYTALPDAFYSTLRAAPDAVLLETTRFDSENFRSFLFIEPLTTLAAYQLHEVEPLLLQLEDFLRQGYFIAGYLTYEAGFAFEAQFQRVQVHLPYPLVWFGVYASPIIFNHRTGTCASHAHRLTAAPLDECFAVRDFHLETLEQTYLQNIARIQAYICAGDVYQINFTTKFRFHFEGSPLALYQSLKQKQRVAYSAVVQTHSITALSFSPELFFRRCGTRLFCKPMKGTSQRGLTNDEDNTLALALQSDAKNRAENLMIADLIRNDLGRLAKLGSVRAPRLFEVERYETLLQMTSTLEAELHESTTYLELFKAIFPCGSITGAPKIRAMQIIHELEQSPRGIYTGAIGFISPEREALFNVAIRTAVLHKHHGEFGVGSGIVWDSDARQEFEECMLKAKFFTVPAQDFELLETILWNGRYVFLAEHLARLADSSHYFDFVFNQAAIEQHLTALARSFLPQKAYRVRLRLNRHGQCFCEQNELAQDPGTCHKVALAHEHTSSQDKFYRHKTTHRRLYDTMYRKALEQGFVDVLFFNEHGELTEGAIHNVIIKKGEWYLTPPLSCGVLNGIYRQHFLQTHSNAKEHVLVLSDLLTADEVWLCNSVRGLRQVEVCEVYL